jgi:glutamine cyclotransferase
MSGARNLLIAALILCSCTQKPKASTTSLTPIIPILNYTVGHVYPHDPTSYTEGFLFHDGHFFESSGAPDDLPQRSLPNLI